MYCTITSIDGLPELTEHADLAEAESFAREVAAEGYSVRLLQELREFLPAAPLPVESVCGFKGDNSMTTIESTLLTTRAASMYHTARRHPECAAVARNWLCLAARRAEQSGWPALAESIRRMERNILGVRA